MPTKKLKQEFGHVYYLSQNAYKVFNVKRQIIRDKMTVIRKEKTPLRQVAWETLN